MKTIKTLLFFLIFGLAAMSCGSDEPAKVSADKAAAEFSSANDAVAADLAAFMEAPGFTAMGSLSSLNSAANPFGRMKSVNREDVRNQINAGLYGIRSILLGSTENGRISGDQPFDFDGKKGVYTYNFDIQDFEFASGGSIVEIHFPTTEGVAVNDGVFKLTAYEEISTPNGDDLYSPTLVQATILVDGTKEAEIDMTAGYDDTDSMNKVDLYLYVNPYTVDLNFDDSKSTSTSFAAALSKDNSVIIGAGISVVFMTSDKQDPKTVNGYFQLMSIKFIINVDATNQNAQDINDIIKITIKIDGANAGKVVFEQDAVTGELVPYVKYNDGTTELLETLFANLETQLGGLM